MRQRGDTVFTELLCRLRLNQCTDDDISILQSREVTCTSDSPSYPTHVLHVYRINAHVDARNTSMLNALADASHQYSIDACDSVASQTSHIDLSTLSNKKSDTGGLHTVLKIAVGARVMLTINVDVSDGLVNGARGEVVHIVTDTNNKVTTILVTFDNPNVGQFTCYSV